MNRRFKNKPLFIVIITICLIIWNVVYKDSSFVVNPPTTPTTTRVPTIQQQATSSGARQDINRTQAAVTKIVDGDTIHVLIGNTKEVIRVIGIDTPETVDPRKPVQCFGRQATEQAIELLAGKTIYLETDDSQSKRDRYGRLLAYIFFENNTDYGKYMIENGFAHEYTYNTSYRYQVEYKQAQEQAMSKKRGLWADSLCE